MVIIGIDPGMSGGIGIITAMFVKAIPMPDTEADINNVFINIKEVARTGIDEIFCLIEKVASMPGQGVASTFKFGKNYGFLRGCLIANNIPFDEVRPIVWQKGLGIPPRDKKNESKTQFKNRLKAKAQQLYPSLKITHATGDAILITRYCQLHYYSHK